MEMLERKGGKVVPIAHPNFCLLEGVVETGKKYTYSESGRRYEVICLDIEKTREIIVIQLQILRSDPKYCSLDVGEIISVSISPEGIGFQGKWFLMEV